MTRQILIRHLLFTIVCLTTSLSCLAEGNASPFEFRAICSPYNINPKLFDIEGTHSIDRDWSLWGHNLWKVLGKDAPSDVYALIDGKRLMPVRPGDMEGVQYCFSSPRLYTMLRSWIIDQWGNKGGRFSIIPMDNKKVCQCARCKNLGNTATNATPAVAALTTKLSKEFPGHKFFMAAYHTTTDAPTKPLPKNAGVLISAIDIPLRMVFQENKGFKKFDATLQEWKKATSLIYVWEYDRNFDDYLSPFPCLMSLQQRLRYYRSQGIRGIFINDSDDAYASFDDMQSYAIAQLMLNPDAEVEKLVRRFYSKFYPESGGIIVDYYLGLEKKTRETNHILPFYGTLQEEMESYLDSLQFLNFCKELTEKSKRIRGEERERLNAMLIGFTYTQLLMNPSPEEKARLLTLLKKHSTVVRPGTKDVHYMMRWKEPENATIDSFIK